MNNQDYKDALKVLTQDLQALTQNINWVIKDIERLQELTKENND